MRDSDIDTYKRRLDGLFDKASQLDYESEILAHWSRYLCVLTSGYVETSVRTVLSEYARNTASPGVANFVENRLRTLRNPKMNSIVELIYTFNPEWASQIESATEGRLADAVNSIVNNRNQIAHGHNVGISFTQMQHYYSDAVRVISIVRNHCT